MPYPAPKTLSTAIGLPVSDGLFLHADWPAPANVKTLVSTRQGGVSLAPYASLNVGAHVGDDAEHVARNRAIVQAAVPVPLAYLNQTHGTNVVAAADALTTLTDYEHVIEEARTTGYIREEEVALLQQWRKDPAHWNV